MGWTYPYGINRKSLIEERTTGWERTEDGTTIKSDNLAKCYKGGMRSGVLWGVWEITHTKNNIVVKRQRFITCDILQYSNHRGHEPGWGYKDLDESMGPYYYSCPLKYLKMVPEVANKEWRDAVLAHHERRREKLREKRKALV